MKSIITVSLLSLSCLLVNQASAEPFNNRGPDWIAAVSPGNATRAASEIRPTLAAAGFNDRGQDWLAAVVPGQGPRECQPGDYFASSYGFNDKSYAPSYTAPTPVSGAMVASSTARQDHLC